MPKMGQYTEETSPSNDDLVVIKENTSGATRRVQLQNLLPAGSVGTTDLADSAVTTAKINNDAVTDDKLDYPRWWQEIGRVTLGTAGDTISLTSLPARKYLLIKVSVINSGVLDVFMRFNNDSSATYAHRSSTNGAADLSTASTLSIPIDAGSYPISSNITVTNIATQEKVLYMQSVAYNTAGAGNIPGRTERTGKWANTSNAISRIDVLNGGAGDFAVGSEVVVLGHD